MPSRSRPRASSHAYSCPRRLTPRSKIAAMLTGALPSGRTLCPYSVPVVCHRCEHEASPIRAAGEGIIDVHSDAHAHDGPKVAHTEPGSLADRGRRLFEFLARAQMLKSS